MDSIFMDFFIRNESGSVFYVPISISQITLGKVVRLVDTRGKMLTDTFGHIVGFSKNSSGERILKVLWDDGVTTEVHPTNVYYCF